MDTPNNRTLFGVLAYLGPLVIVSLFMSNNDSFVKFHAKQGLVLFIAEVVISVLGGMFWHLWMLLNLINLACFVFSIIGIMNVVGNKEQELPLIGGLAKSFTF
jgi:fumarate reductase subunit D